MDSVIIVPLHRSVTVRFGTIEHGGIISDDGEFQIHYDTTDHPNRIVVKESAGLPGSVKGGASEILYEEHFDNGYIDEITFKGVATFCDGWQQRCASIYRKQGFQWVGNDNGDVTLRKGSEFVLLQRNEFTYLNGRRVYVGHESEKDAIIMATPEYDGDLDSLIWDCHLYISNEAESIEAAHAYRKECEKRGTRNIALFEWLRDDWFRRESTGRSVEILQKEIGHIKDGTAKLTPGCDLEKSNKALKLVLDLAEKYLIENEKASEKGLEAINLVHQTYVF